jgi:hypothetical protein
MSKFNWELTDTFGGEANYCWVRRGTIEADTLERAVRKFYRAEIRPGTRRKRSMCGDSVRIDFPHHNTVAFLGYCDEQEGT